MVEVYDQLSAKDEHQSHNQAKLCYSFQIMQSATIADFLQESIDFLIIGGGTAGLVLAARLSEDPNVRVGVVEAGLSRLEDPNVELPTGAALMLNNPDYDWKFQSVPQVGVLPFDCLIQTCLVRAFLTIWRFPTERNEGQSLSYPTRENARWLQWHQLHGLRSAMRGRY